MEETFSNPVVVGGGLASIFAFLTVLARFKGWLSFETDQSQFREDLMKQIAAERAQSVEIASQLAQANRQLSELTLEQLQMRVTVDAIRSQMRQLLGILVDVKEGRLAPEHIRVPEVPASIMGDDR